HPAQRAGLARIHPAQRVVGSGSPGQPVSGAGGESAGDPRWPLRRLRRRRPRPGPAGAPAPRAPELPRRVRRHHLGQAGGPTPRAGHPLTFLDAEALSRLLGVKLRARALMEGVLSGLHKSPHQGQSVEFAQHKEYAPGDELRHLDWKAFGKFDKYYVKRFEHETNLRGILVVDASASMGYASVPLSKLQVAATLAGAIGYLLVRQQDAAGLAVISGQKMSDIPARAAAGHLTTLLDALERIEPRGTTDLFFVADQLAEKVQRRSFIAVFSDLFDDRQDALKRVLQLRARKNDVVVFQVL